MNQTHERAAPASALGLSRRRFATAFATYALLAEAHAQAPSRTSAARWVDAQEEIARALAAGQMAPSAWQAEVEGLAARVDVAELMVLVNRSRLIPAGAPSGNDPSKRYVRFLDESGAPRRLHYAAAIFAFEPQNVITPHGHKHMVSAHMIIEGALRVRNFDRVRDEAGAVVIRPTQDYVAGVGRVSTMSSERDNIHWFVPQDGRSAATFDVIISDLDPGQASYEITPVDPLGGRRLADGAIVAPIMSFAESSRRYTADV